MTSGVRWLLLLVATLVAALILVLLLPHTPILAQPTGEATVDTTPAIRISLAGQPQPVPPAAIDEPVTEPAPEPAVEPPRQPAPAPTAEPEPVAEQKPAAVPQPAPEPAQTSTTDVASTAPQPDAPATEEPSAQQRPQQVELHAGVSSEVDSYLSRLYRHLNRHFEYPRRALRLGQEGTPVVLFEFNRQGELVSYALQDSSSFTLLDQAALTLLEAANPLPPVPEHMTGRTFTFRLPVTFKLR